jgi:ubiquinone/menaquinone biosynthesis C-methylase UbiE/DNA-binding transcriptional ArsR family regulator
MSVQLARGYLHQRKNGYKDILIPCSGAYVSALPLALDPLLAALKAAGEDTRLRILALVSRSDLTVTDLTDILGQSQPRISRHLKLLFEAGLVERHREGAWVFYALSRGGERGKLVDAILATLDPNDRLVARDRMRLDGVRTQRSAAAQTYFKGVAENWSRIRSLHIAEADVEASIRSALGNQRFAMHVDVGTGTGRMLELMADRTERGIGVDFSHDMLAVARSGLDRPGLAHLSVRHGDITSLPVPDQSADLVTVHQVLHFLDDPMPALAECRRVLKPGGTLLVVDFAPHEHEFLREAHAHRRLGFAPDQMQAWFAAAGLEAGSFTALSPTEGVTLGLTVSLWLARRTGVSLSSIGVAA